MILECVNLESILNDRQGKVRAMKSISDYSITAVRQGDRETLLIKMSWLFIRKGRFHYMQGIH